MNHSCCPNVIVTYKGTLAEVRAVQEIEPGDEVNPFYMSILLQYCACASAWQGIQLFVFIPFKGE